MLEILTNTIDTVLENKGASKLNSITESTHLREDIGFDSLDLAELTVRIESEFGIDIFEDGVISTVGEVLAKLKNAKDK